MCLADHFVENAIHSKNKVFRLAISTIDVNFENVLVKDARLAIPDETPERSTRRTGPRKQDVA